MDDGWIDDLVNKLDGIKGDDPDYAHFKADALVEECLPPEVQSALIRLKNRCSWWRFS